jgi:hypothetical protein
MVVRAASLRVLAGPLIFFEGVDRRWIRITVVEVTYFLAGTNYRRKV